MNKVVILAAGKGKRMGSDTPKALSIIKERPMVEYLINSVNKTSISKPPILVVNSDNIKIFSEKLAAYKVDYAIQEEQLGTGHAVLSAKDLVEDDVENIIVLYGDHPFIKAESIERLINEHKTEVSMLVIDLNDFNDWRSVFYNLGRVIIENNSIKEIIEYKDANEDVKKVTKINPAIFCFNRKWLFERLPKLKNNNNQQEYYLTDLIKVAFEENIKINFSLVEPKEAIGVNRPEELEIAKNLANNFIF